jgi:hypothetical protein
MRGFMLGAVTTMVVLVPLVGNAQVNKVDTPRPLVTAAGLEWQTSDEPVVFNGDLYYPAGPRVFFDGRVMAQIGVFRGVPLYADTTLEPNSIVYVPVSGGQLRPYERRRSRDLAGTAGSRSPEFPIASSSLVGEETPPPAAATVGGASVGLPEPQPAGTIGTIVERSRGLRLESIPPPRSNAGIWIEFDGARWYNAGAAVPFSSERFVPAGEYHGFAVYRARNGADDRIYVPAVAGGPLVPYRK